MKTISQTYKDNIKQLGKEITYEITYGNTTLGDEDILNANLHYDGGMLKSVMKQLDIELYNDIPIGTELTYKFGVKVDDTNYEKINYGKFIVYSSEKLEDSNTYKLVCYDKMLYAMKDYEAIKGKNLFDKDTQNYKKGYYLNASGVETSGADWGVYYIPVIPNTSYTISGCQTNGGVQFCWFNENKTFISAIGQKQNRTMTSPSNAGYIGLSIVWNTSSSAYDNNIMLEKGSTATTYKEYFKYPCTIKNYIDALSYDLGYTFDNDDFTNYDKTIENELYIDNEGNSLGYTYRDVLDELAQATASTICINNNDELEIQYITNANEEKTSISGTSLSMTAHDNKVDIDLLGNTTQNGTPTPSSPIPVNVVSGDNTINICGKNLLKFDNSQNRDKSRWSYTTETPELIVCSKVSGGGSFYAVYETYVEENQQYTISVEDDTNRNLYCYKDVIWGTAVSGLTNKNINKTTSLTFTSSYTGKMIVGFFTSDATKTLTKPQIEKGSTATEYEPYQSQNYTISLGDIELCKIGDYQDYIYKENGNWYKYSAIGKVVLDGSETWISLSALNTTDYYAYYMENSTFAMISDSVVGVLSNYFIGDTRANRTANKPNCWLNSSASQLYVHSPETTVSNFQTWLSTHNTTVYYVLATPTYTKIENDELIGQLEHIRLLNGYNNVISSSPITLDYVSSIDTIDEEYLKDINVNFGEMTKPINTITFKRSGDSDAISLSYPEDLGDDKKNEIAISDNQILNYDNRDEYLKGILDRLYGLTYCLNDYTSTGITYYDLCDRYEVSITRTDVDGNTLETNFYPCIMFNDEINVNQGLQEIVHTDRAEESITDYNTTTKTDRLKTRTDLIVDKQNGEILAVTGVLDIQEDGTSKVINGIQTTQTKDRLKIEAIVTKEGEGENEVYTGVRTGKGFTFDNSGLNITSSDNTYKTQIDEQGTYYYDGSEKLGETTKEGSKFKNMDLYGEFRYCKDDINDTTHPPLFVSMKYTDDNTEVGFGHFWNGD